MQAAPRDGRPGGGATWLLVLVVLAATGGAMAATAFGALDRLSGVTHDRLVEIRNETKPAPSSVVMVAVDARTVSRQRGLPLNRSRYASAIERLSALGATAIAVDIQFSEPSSDQDADLALLEAIEDTETPVILATSQVFKNGDTPIFGGRANLEPAGAVAAHSSLPADDDSRIRRIDRSVDGLVVFSQATAQATGRPGIPRDGTLLDPSIPGNKLDTISMQDLLEGKATPAQIRGRIAVIGVTVVSNTGDDEQRIAGSSLRIPGVAAQAQAIDTALRGEPLKDAGETVAYLLALLAGLLAAAGSRRTLWVQLGVAVVAMVLLVGGAVLAVKLGWLVDPVPAFAAVLVASLCAMAVRAESERRRRATARATLGRFVPPGVVDDLLDGGSNGLIAPRAQQATVVFCDLRGYTSLVASLRDPQALIAILDAYLSAVTQTVHRHGGTVVSFQGDGVMSAFGTPVPTDEAPAQAVAAARELQTRALPQVRRELAEIVEGADDLRLGVGVATGSVFAGTVGPPERREYAVVGPTTNLAARLQALTKTEGVDVVMDGATAAGAGAPANARSHTGIVTVDDVGLRSLGPREVRGLTAPVDVWTLAEPGDESPGA